jgi:hypothetical protein
LNQESAVEWLRTGPVNALLAGQPEGAYAEAASDWLQVMKERSADQALRFDVLLHVISARHL